MAKRSKKKLKYQTRTPISGHKQVGKVLQPPFVHFGMGRGNLVSWMNDRLPEMLWASLIIAALGREAALGVFRRFLTFIGEHPRKEDFWDGTLTGFGALADADRRELLRCLCRSEQVRHALAPLLLFSGLPARNMWQEMLQNQSPASLDLIMTAVRMTLFHQTQESTDCRWVRLMCALIGGRLIYPAGESTAELLEYPNRGDQRHVRPCIRSTEGLLDPAEERDLTWPKAFWLECWEKTPCMGLAPQQPAASSSFDVGPLTEVRRRLETHWENTHSTTAVDARHDAVFGMAFYALRLMEESLSFQTGHTTLGRLALRTLFEIRITLRYLLDEEDTNLWQEWRAYGAGQAKLASLKLDEATTPPGYLDAKILQQVANEDFWEELVSVDLGHWARADLRKMSQKVNLKDLYDQYYPWTSGFGHGQWGPIRESIFATCLNPLHRAHRYPQTEKPPLLAAITDDIRGLVNAILDDLSAVYPAFSHRV